MAENDLFYSFRHFIVDLQSIGAYILAIILDCVARLSQTGRFDPIQEEKEAIPRSQNNRLKIVYT